MHGRIPMRTCIGCGQTKDKRELIRVIRTPEGGFALDITGKANGRGAYLCPQTECLMKARRKKALNRSFGQEVPAEIYDALELQLQTAAGQPD